MRFLTDRNPDTGLTGFQMMIYRASRHNGIAERFIGPNAISPMGFQKPMAKPSGRGMGVQDMGLMALQY